MNDAATEPVIPIQRKRSRDDYERIKFLDPLQVLKERQAEEDQDKPTVAEVLLATHAASDRKVQEAEESLPLSDWRPERLRHERREARPSDTFRAIRMTAELQGLHQRLAISGEALRDEFSRVELMAAAIDLGRLVATGILLPLQSDSPEQPTVTAAEFAEAAGSIYKKDPPARIEALLLLIRKMNAHPIGGRNPSAFREELRKLLHPSPATLQPILCEYEMQDRITAPICEALLSSHHEDWQGRLASPAVPMLVRLASDDRFATDVRINMLKIAGGIPGAPKSMAEFVVLSELQREDDRELRAAASELIYARFHSGH